MRSAAALAVVAGGGGGAVSVAGQAAASTSPVCARAMRPVATAAERPAGRSTTQPSRRSYCDAHGPTGCCVCSDASLSDFSCHVLHLTARVPRGRVTTYGELSRAISGSTGASRAVGGVLRHNRFNDSSGRCVPRVPCHRVVASDGGMGGFSGVTDAASDEIRRKTRLLSEEGVAMKPMRSSATSAATAGRGSAQAPQRFCVADCADRANTQVMRAAVLLEPAATTTTSSRETR